MLLSNKNETPLTSERRKEENGEAQSRVVVEPVSVHHHMVVVLVEIQDFAYYQFQCIKIIS